MPTNPPQPKTVLYLIRHGEPADGYADKFYGQIDVPLSERGMRQSHATAERLSSVPFFAVYSSDLQRASFMAKAIAEPRDLPVREVEVFRERCLGEFQGLSEEEMRARDMEQYKLWNANRIFHRCAGGGENFEDLRDRVIPALEGLVQSFQNQRIALVTHAGPIRVALAHVLGMPMSSIFNLTVDYANISVIEFPLVGPPKVRMVNG